jgi:hypothetical protein
MRKFKVGNLRLDNRAISENLGSNNIIFVGSSTDMFADDVPKELIEEVLKHCKEFDNNTYLFQTKNPKRFKDFIGDFPTKTILGTTIESNRIFDGTKAPSPEDRWYEMFNLGGFDNMVSIEPIMDFDLDILVNMLEKLNPKYISIGADSQNSNLKEPTKENIEALIIELRKFTEVKLKDNLKRLLSIPPQSKASGILEEFL